jgi:hypothetical protein
MTEPTVSRLRQMRKRLCEDASRCRSQGMSADEWEERTTMDLRFVPMREALGAKAVRAISALTWGWDKRKR